MNNSAPPPSSSTLGKNQKFSKKLQDDILKIYEKYLNSSSTLLIKYYNKLKDITIIIDGEEINFLDYLKDQKRKNKKNLPLDVQNILQNILNEYLELEKKLMDDFIDMLEEIYKLVSLSIVKRYGRRKYPISSISFFEEDGMTIIERLRRWFCPFTLHQDLENPNDIPTLNKFNFDCFDDKLKAIHQLDLIIKTECLYQQEIVKKDKLSGFCEWVEICFGGGDCKSDCEEYCDEYPVNEVPAYPPFHTNCGCYTNWIVSDDWEDVEDLDLEDDLDEEYYDEEIKEIEEE